MPRMKHFQAVAAAAIAFSCLAAGGNAEEGLVWFGDSHPEGASLFYGLPESSYAPLSFRCAAGSAILNFEHEHEPIVAVDGVGVTVTLEAGDISVPIETTGLRLEMDDLFVLQGETVLDDRFTDLITSRGMLSVFVEDGAAEYPLDGAREAAAHIIEKCRGG